MELTKFVRRPFTVEAIEITEENIEELAQFIGTIRTKGDGGKYIAVDRTLIPTVDRVYPGFWLTRMGNNDKCYSRKVFMREFIELSPRRAEALEVLSTPDHELSSEDCDCAACKNRKAQLALDVD